METLIYLLTALIAFSGLFVGKALAVFASEEMAAGKKYFSLMQSALLIAIVALLVNAFNFILVFRIMIYAALITMLFLIKKPRSEMIYPLLGVLFFFGSRTNYILAISSLMFLYGFPAGSLMHQKHGFLKLFAYHMPFLVISLLLPLVF